jgi:hypothetical protein
MAHCLGRVLRVTAPLLGTELQLAGVGVLLVAAYFWRRAAYQAPPIHIAVFPTAPGRSSALQEAFNERWAEANNRNARAATLTAIGVVLQALGVILSAAGF